MHFSIIINTSKIPVIYINLCYIFNYVISAFKNIDSDLLSKIYYIIYKLTNTKTITGLRISINYILLVII